MRHSLINIPIKKQNVEVSGAVTSIALMVSINHHLTLSKSKAIPSLKVEKKVRIKPITLFRMRIIDFVVIGSQGKFVRM